MSNDEVVQDFRRRYEGTFVFLHRECENEDSLVKVRSVESSPSKMGVLHLESPKFGSLTLNMGSDGHSLKFKYPPVGVFQYGRDAYMFRRRPQRQYRRGVCNDNSLLWNVTRSFAGSFVNWSADEVQAAYDHKVYSFKDAIAALRTNATRSVALADNFSVSKSIFNSPEHVIWYWQYPIARCDEKGNITRVYEDVFKTKLEEIAK
jgi:hypothetical protein